jgi:hypothetical protein
LDRYAVRYANFVAVVTRMAVLGAQSAPKGTGEPAGAPRRYQGRSPWLVLITVALSLLAAVLDAKEPSLKTVLARASGYVERFERDLSGIVAEEHYVQEVESLDALPSEPPAPLLDASHRELRSDLLLVRTGGSDQYVQFRDVFEVDGQPVRDRSDRLLKMFTQPTDATASQTRNIADESARYNIGHMVRNINVPVLPLRFLHPFNRSRFKFSLKSRGAGPSVTADLPQSPTFRVSTEVWVIEYREAEARTMIRTNGQSDLPSRGRFWIEPSTGRVLMSEFIAENSQLQARIDVSYQSEPLVDLYVPVEMHETYMQRNYPYRITGTAIYSNFRRFDVSVNESFRLIGR